ncbi:hypothetical protein ACFVYA_13465 [Amycolatopsis sp. NPDC058278]|uniref:hypothetical protein n=1 Tax=Amycolatopsis sp. NPDC058278 TaxID=3346417 RepID=UPI0036DE9CF0
MIASLRHKLKDSWLQLWPVITLDGRTGSIDRFAGVRDPATWHLVSQPRMQAAYRTAARAWFDRLSGSQPAWGIAAAVATLLCCPVGAIGLAVTSLIINRNHPSTALRVGAIVIAAANALIVAVFAAVLLTTHHGAWRSSYSSSAGSPSARSCPTRWRSSRHRRGCSHRGPTAPGR